MSKLYIIQPIGLGDIFFCQKIAKIFCDNDFDVIWPVFDIYYEEVSRLNGRVTYIKQSAFDTYAKVDLVPGKLTKVNKDYYLQLDKCKSQFQGVMLSKYKEARVDSCDWLNYFKYNRNISKEKELYYDVLGLHNKKYQLINTGIGGPGHESSWKIPWVNQNLLIVNLRKIHGFTIFDWLYTIENSVEMHLMETSICYLIESLVTIPKKFHLFSRSSITSLNYWEFFKIYKKTKYYFPSNFVERIA